MVDINVTISEPEEISVSLDGGVTNFRALTDTPSSFSGEANKVVSVNSGETALEFTSADGGAWGGITGTLSDQTDLQNALNAKEEDLTFSTGLTRSTNTITTNDGQIVHQNLSGAGSNTHAQIDTHVGSTSNPHSVDASDVSLGNVTNVATDDTGYNSTTWDANTDAATKNAIRDKIETMDTAIGLNTSKNTNVSTDLSEGTSTETTVDVDSSDGTNATLASASTTRAGLLTKSKFDEIVVNNAKVTYDDAAAVSSNTTHRGLTNNPHSVDSGDVGLSNVTNVATDDTAYNATSWDGNNDAATKNALRDKFETLPGGHDPVTLNASATTGGMSLSTQEISNRAATNSQTGYMTSSLVGNIETNNAKNTNVSTNLSEGTSTETTVDVNSSDGTNATLASASTTRAGLLTKAKWDEIVANTTKDTNVSTNLSAGTRTATTIDVNSSDGTNATLVEADTTNAGILGSDKWDEIVANTEKVSFSKTNVKGQITHGATAGTARPTGFTSVEWQGTVEPTNAVNEDTWIDTT